VSDELRLNKIFGAVLATGLVIFGLGQLVDIFNPYQAPAKAGYSVDISAELVDTGGPKPAPDVPPDWGTALPAANVSAGQQVSAKCQSCHTFTQGGPNGTGPNLYGVVGRKVGTEPGFSYDQPLQDLAKKQPIWTYDALYAWLKSPGTVAPGTKMTFVGLPSPQDRINIIAYLHTLGSSLPVPPPNPKAAAAAAAPAASSAKPAAGAAASSAPASSAAPAASAGGAAKG
jgi:cytochrome c